MAYQPKKYNEWTKTKAVLIKVVSILQIPTENLEEIPMSLDTQATLETISIPRAGFSLVQEIPRSTESYLYQRNLLVSKKVLLAVIEIGRM